MNSWLASMRCPERSATARYEQTVQDVTGQVEKAKAVLEGARRAMKVAQLKEIERLEQSLATLATIGAKTQDGPLKPQFVIEQLRDASPEDTIVASGVGQHQMWTSQHWKFDHPYTWVNSGGLGTMGFSIPAAIGAKVGRPERMVWAIDGDGCFQMTAQELVTASVEQIPIKVAILNNSYLGMVRQWQEMFYEERYSEVYLTPDVPDYTKWAEAMGCVAFRVDSPEDVAPTIEKANAIDDRPVVIDFRTDYREKVFPMVPAGASNDDVITGPTNGAR